MRTRLTLIASTALTLALPVLAHAQDAAAPQNNETGDAESSSGEIVVTARRTEERLQDVPVAITAFLR